jgi:putative FmdB family regulatory protein
MPIYVFLCPECGNQEEVLRPMSQSDEPHDCAECGGETERDYHAERPNATGTEKGETFWSQSLAISPDQAAEHRRLFPNVRVREDGCLGFDSNRERERYCNKTGFEKVQGRSRRRGRRIS